MAHTLTGMVRTRLTPHPWCTALVVKSGEDVQLQANRWRASRWWLQQMALVIFFAVQQSEEREQYLRCNVCSSVRGGGKKEFGQGGVISV